MIDPENLFFLIQFFDIGAAVVFAVSGSLVASRKGMDVMGFMWFAVITGVGGGTVRDLILGVPLWLHYRGCAAGPARPGSDRAPASRCGGWNARIVAAGKTTRPVGRSRGRAARGYQAAGR